MQNEMFLRWLLEKRKLGSKSAHDALSRCKRIESILGQKLEKAATSQVEFDSALRELRRSLPHRADLMYAMRLFATFKNPRISTKQYAFYGDSENMRQLRNVQPTKIQVTS
jgi:hypothetical protein